MRSRLPRALEDLVKARAEGRCEYCRLPQAYHPLPFAVDHVIARQHGGEDVAENLALACVRCNLHKGPNLAGIDPARKRLARLYHPRKDRWDAHFAWTGAEVVGLTPVGRATIAVLTINHPDAVALRAALIDEGVFFDDGPAGA